VTKKDEIIEILKVRKIVSIMPMTSVPDAPPYMAGMINLSGSMVPVTNLRLRLGLAAADYTSQTCIIVTESGTEEKSKKMGIIVDAVTDVRGFKARDIESPSELSLKIDTEFILGIAKSDDGMKIIIQPANINL
jgi:purine-binding chemotaxis protein CheW